MDKFPLISIVVPIFNLEYCLHECLSSIELQSLKNFEVLLIDDGSTDKSSDICYRFLTKDDRFKYFFQRNLGLSKAREKGIKEAIGKYICFIDGDDRIAPNYLEVLSAPLKSGSFNISFCNYNLWFADNSLFCKNPEYKSKALTDEEFASVILSLSNKAATGGYLWNKMFFTNDIKKLKTPKTRGAEDEVFLFNLLSEKNRIYYSSEVCYFYRQRRGSLVNRESFRLYLTFSRRFILKNSSNQYKFYVQLAYISSIISLIANFLLGKENKKKDLLIAKKLANEAKGLLKEKAFIHFLQEKKLPHVKYRLLLNICYFPDIILIQVLRFNLFKISSFVLSFFKLNNQN